MCCCYSKFRQIPNWFSVFLSSSILASSSCISLCYQVDSGVNVTFLDSQYLRYPVTKIFAKTEFVPFLNKLIPGPGWHTPTKVPWLWLIRRFPRLFSFKIALRSQPVSPASRTPNIRHQVIVLQSALVARSNSSSLVHLQSMKGSAFYNVFTWGFKAPALHWLTPLTWGEYISVWTLQSENLTVKLNCQVSFQLCSQTFKCSDIKNKTFSHKTFLS